MTPILPPEIIVLVAEELSNDFSSLKNVSLVCSTWLPPTRPHLFHSVRVTPPTFPRFLALSSHPLSSFSASVKCIQLDLLNSLESDPANVLGQSISRLAEILDSTVSFRLCNVNFVQVETIADVLGNITAAFRNILQLELDGVSLDSVTQTMWFICAFPRVEKVAVRDLVWNDPSGDNDAHHTFRIPSTLMELRLERCYKRDIMDCLLLQHPLPIIPRLDVGIVAPEDSWAIGQYIEKVGGHLRDLSLGFHSLDAGGDAEDFYHACDLGLSTGLHSIYFKRFISLWEYRLTSAVPWIIRILSRISAPAFETIYFGVHVSHIDQLDPFDLPEDFDWEALDHSLSEIRLPNFQSVTFLIFIHSLQYGGIHIVDAIEVERLIKVYLPLTWQRGVLRFKTYMKGPGDEPG
ncbi:hypothetical protein WG66_000947 [Moniliophthora roreri]|uniref:F-box domain-containing protein n=1 Tax=Moniliophthora roreri TaxID=221103 RepID=A0A0W0F147_MONRR|nr:hypothetical protein WG66_000947 [Moniliophthora roreri]